LPTISADALHLSGVAAYQLGERVAGSLLSALDLPELVTS
jgi:hypothetical protein